MATKNLLSVNQYAAHRNVARSTVQAAVARKKIPSQIIDGETWIDQAAADIAWDEQKRKRGEKNTKGKKDLVDAQTIKTQYDAKLARLEYKKEIGKLVDKEIMDALFFKISRTVRNSILSVPGRISHMIAASSDPAECDRLMTEELCKALRGLADEQRKTKE